MAPVGKVYGKWDIGSPSYKKRHVHPSDSDDGAGYCAADDSEAPEAVRGIIDILSHLDANFAALRF